MPEYTISPKSRKQKLHDAVNQLKRSFSPAQRTYMQIRAIHDSARDAYLERVAQLPKPDWHNHNELEAHVDAQMQIERETGYHDARYAMIEAERRLIEWVRQTMESLPQYRAKAVELERVWNSPLPSIREKLIDLCLKLSA